MKNGGDIPQAQDGTKTISSRQKKGIELQIKELKKEQADKKELQTTGQVKNPKSISYKKKKESLEKKQTYISQDNRTDYEREKDREKGQAIEDKKQLKKNILAPVDVVTDIMQVGNFVPNPIGQGIGKVGNILGAVIDAYQAYDALSEEDYTSTAVNAGSVLLPMGLGSKTFRRNSKYLQPGQPLYPFSPQANLPANATFSMRLNSPRVNYIEPFTKVQGMTDTSLLANRTLLGTLGAETVYDIPKQKNGGWLDNYGTQANYNDSKATASPDMIGEGFSNVGRNYSPAWGGQFQGGGYVKKKLKKTERELLKKYVDPSTKKALERANQQGINTGIHNGPLDAIRHSSSAAAMTSALPTWTNFIPGVAPLKIAATNVAGAAHEIGSPNSWKEHASDLYNNFIGSVVGALPIPEETQHDLLIKAQKYGVLSDMGNKTPLRKKPAAPQLPPLPKRQTGGKLKFLQPTSDRLPEGYRIPYDTPSTERATSIGGVDGEPAYLIPSFKYGKPLYDPLEEFKRTGEHLGGPFKTWQEADEWEKTVRHPAVENRETIMFPQEKFQTGGSLPGSVGFTYARTKGIPSNGPYAKKTLASAQNGQEMKYYQNGLDFKPKSISRDGAWLNKYEQAQTGKTFKLKDERLQAIRPSESTYVKKPNFEAEQAKVQRTYVDQLGKQMAEEKRRKKLTKEQREREDYNTINEQRGSIQSPVEESTWDRTKAIVSNPLTAFGYVARNESLPTRFQHGERNTLDYAVDWINPLQGAAALSEIPGELGRGEFLNAGLSALDAADLGVYARGAMKASKPLLQKAGQQLGNVKMSIAPELRQGLRTAGSSINNIGKKSIITDLKQGLANFNPKNLKSESGLDWMKQWYEHPDFVKRYKATGEYSPFGMQNHILNQLDEYQPKNYLDLLKDKGVKEYINKSITSGGVSWGVPESIYHNRTMYGPFNKKGIESTKTHELTHLIENNGRLLSDKDQNSLLKPFGYNTEEIFGRDIPPNKLLGRDKAYYLDPTEIHARMNQSRFELGLSPENKFTEEMFDSVMKKNEFSGMGKYIKDKKGFTDLMNNFWAVPPAVIGAGALQQSTQEEAPQYKQGGIIKDDRGQWDHPGEITEIGSNQITMQGVPYPVLGISDTGDTKLMLPNKNYKFKGKKVTEYPMAKNGINNLDARPLVKLDQLTNFTNYNKPQPGSGWLSKYN